MSYDYSTKTDLPIAGPLMCAVLAIAAICLLLASGTIMGNDTQRSKVFVPTTTAVVAAQ